MKRFFDVLLSSIFLIALIPILLLITILIKINLGSPILFIQKRPGKDMKVFKMYKFRTMKNLDEGMIDDDETRITKLGTFLRNYSLDELPELFNVLKGDMSLVGPRPLLEEYVPLYSKEQLKRHKVKPGITGWAQINGRNSISWEEKFKLDVWYVNNRSLFLDFKILFLTIKKVMFKENISKKRTCYYDKVQRE